MFIVSVQGSVGSFQGDSYKETDSLAQEFEIYVFTIDSDREGQLIFNLPEHLSVNTENPYEFKFSSLDDQKSVLIGDENLPAKKINFSVVFNQDEVIDSRNQSFTVDLRIDYSSEAQDLGAFQDVFQTRAYDFAVYSSSPEIRSDEDVFGGEGTLLDNESEKERETITNETRSNNSTISIGRRNTSQENSLTEQNKQINENVNFVTLILILVIITALVMIVREVF